MLLSFYPGAVTERRAIIVYIGLLILLAVIAFQILKLKKKWFKSRNYIPNSVVIIATILSSITLIFYSEERMSRVMLLLILATVISMISAINYYFNFKDSKI